jgi:hypothetical protein
MSEFWKDVIGYEGYYQVSNKGNVKSIERNVTIVRLGNIQTYLKKEKILKQGNCGKYLNVDLCKNSVRKTFMVHRLVASSFIFEIKPNMVVNHKDLNGKNNNLKNLEICTQKDNIQHAMRNNSFTIGAKNGMSKLSNKDVIYIKKSLLNPYFGINNDLAKKFNVSPSSISEIRNGKTWKSINL